MNFNRNNTVNQRLDRITMKHAIVGIDIAKDVHAAQMTDFRGRCLTKRHLSFLNRKEGFERLLQWVKNVQAKHGLTKLIVGLEPTGHYWFNLANWLMTRGISVVLVNPVTTHRNKENRDNSPSKNDPKDALVIADVVSRGYYSDYLPQAEQFERLKTVMSCREYWSKQQTSVSNRIIRWIDLYFPEFRDVFKEWDGKRAIATLRAFPLPCDLKGKSIEEVIQAWYDQGMRRAGGRTGMDRAANLLAAAANSIGERRAPEEARKDLQRLLDHYEGLTRELKEIHQEVEALLGEIPLGQQLMSIPNLGPIAVAAILGFGGNLSNYEHGRQLLRRAGLNLAERTSGKHKGQVKIAKRGDSDLRKYLYLATVNLVGHNDDFKRWHEHNQNKGMKKSASLFKLIGKLARIVVGMARRGETYRPQLPELSAA